MRQNYIGKVMEKIPDEIIVTVPGSKSITNRALLLAALADGNSILQGALFSDDSRYFIKALEDLGFLVIQEEQEAKITIKGGSLRIPEIQKQEASVYVGSAGTAARFLTALAGFTKGRYYLDASEQMRKRPMAPLLQCLSNLGAVIEYKNKEGCFPFLIDSTRVRGGQIRIDIGVSSQFLSALLMSGVMLKEGLTIEIGENRKAKPYVDMTIKMMEQFGVEVEQLGEKRYIVPGGCHYQARNYQIEPDVSAACYFYAMAALLGTKVCVRQVHFGSLQGDLKFLEVLKRLGCKVQERRDGIVVTGPRGGSYEGITVDMNDFSDQTMTVAVLAAFAKTPTTVTGVGHIRYQESDRIHAICTELRRLQLSVEEREDGFVIYPGKMVPCEIETYEDHRMAMAFSLIGLKVPQIVIKNPDCCKKTFEHYFDLLDDIRE